MAKKEGSAREKKRKKKSLIIMLVAIVVLMVALDAAAVFMWASRGNGTKTAGTGAVISSGSDFSRAKVAEVVDGNTLKLENGAYVRLIGIDAPKAGEQYASDGVEFLKLLVLGKTVKLEKDAKDKDDYGALLRYVYVDYIGREIFINKGLVEMGYAVPLPVQPNVKHELEIEKARVQCLKARINLCG